MAEDKNYCGIGIGYLPIDTGGIMITEVGHGSPAEKSGLRSGDVLLKMREPGGEWRPVSKDADGIRGPVDTSIDFQVQDYATQATREVDGVTRDGIERLTLTPDDSVCRSLLSGIPPQRRERTLS